MWILEQIISEICDAYEALPGGREPLPRTEDDRPLLGNLEKFENKGYRVVWTLTAGSFGAATKVGGTDGAIYQAIATFQVWIWQRDLETAWDMMVDLLAAIRATAYGPNMGPQNFLAPTETEGRHAHDGELLTLSVNIAVPIPGEGSIPVTTVELQSHESNISMGAESAVLDETYVAIETVEVTGPPEP